MDATLDAETIPTPGPACNLIMKGGITSGVIYPRLVCELARTYRLTAIGGSSAGAIAAAAAAIAEYRRQRDHTEAGFDALASLPEDLTKKAGKGSVLLSLFHPQPKTAPLFNAILAVLNTPPQRSALFRAFATVRGFVRSFWLFALLGAVPGIALAAWGVFAGGQAPAIGLVGGAVIGLVGAAVGIALAAWHTLSTRVPQNLFGLCSGRGGPSDAPALTDWLHRYFQELAGRSVDDDPITFDDLESYGINLRMMTTNLTQRRPMAMPWAEGGFYFHRAEWERLFPEEVVDWMSGPANPPVPPKSAAKLAAFNDRQARASEANLVPLPFGDRVPVIVAVRMSLSFPLLISAVPLATVRRTDDGEEFVTNWFTDGGLCANLPVHFFDRPIPSRPTFAIDLEQTDQPIIDVDAGSSLPSGNNEGLSRSLITWEATEKGALAKFSGAMLATWQGWVDNEALRLPGYRDRVVTIYTTANEGGLNLDMDPETVTALADRGRGAGAKLVNKFTSPYGGLARVNGFDNHRWLRLRASLSGLAEWLDDFDNAFAADAPGGKPYSELLKLRAADLPSYRKGVTAVRALVGRLRALAGDTNPQLLSADSPRPRARLRLTPYDRAAAERPPRMLHSEDIPDDLDGPVG